MNKLGLRKIFAIDSQNVLLSLYCLKFCVFTCFTLTFSRNTFKYLCLLLVTMQDRIFQLLVEDNEISWKSIIYDLVNSEQMDPWDVDVSSLTQKYVERLTQLREKDLKLSGKVLLAAAILLKIKSKRLVGDDMQEFDRLIAGTELDANEFYDGLEQELKQGEALALEEQGELMPHLPEPRKRKVSVHDLVSALEKALEVKKRRLWNSLPSSNVVVPEKMWDLGDSMKSVYARIKDFVSHGVSILFSSLLSSKTKEEKIFTFIPLLHLANQRKVELLQETPFGEIEIKVLPEVMSDGSQQNGEGISGAHGA